MFILALIHQVCSRHLLCARLLRHRDKYSVIPTLKVMSRSISGVLPDEELTNAKFSTGAKRIILVHAHLEF